MISAACAQLGERALVCSGGTDFNHVPIDYAGAFPACRAVVYHGGVGTTAAGLRAGVPTLILSTLGDQTFWAAQLKRLKVGFGRPLSATTQESLVADLRRTLTPQYVTRARQIATQMTTRRKRCGRRRSPGKFRPLGACWLIGDRGPSG
jgi:UDP:flavonoid glycosyltransferase YjiC (YdhE family)